MGTQSGRVTPDLVRGLMTAHGISSAHALAKLAGVSHSAIYEFLNGDNATLGVSTRRKLAAIFPESKQLFVADIVGASPEAQ